MSKKHNILLVDDQKENLDLYQNIFRKTCTVFTALDGDSAIKILTENDINLVLSDQKMPAMTGVELLTLVKEQKSEVRRLLITAYSEVYSAIDAINKGSVHRYISKPCDMDELKQIVLQELKFYDLEQENKRLAKKLEEQNQKLIKWNEELEKKVLKRTDELKKIQEELIHSAKLALIGKLASNMAHELKNQLIGVKIFFELIEKKIQNDKELSKTLINIKEHYHIMFDILGEFWNLSQKDVSKYPKESCDVTILIKEVIELIKFDSLCNKHEIIYYPSGPPIILYLNKNKIKQVLLNLIRNAAQAIKNKGKIIIETGGINEDEFYSIDIIDNGEGIPEKIRNKIWEPFFTTREDGLGLGLDICKQIINAHNGKIFLVPNKEKGTICSVLLPAK